MLISYPNWFQNEKKMNIIKVHTNSRKTNYYIQKSCSLGSYKKVKKLEILNPKIRINIMSVMKKIINSPLVPKLPGAYNQAVQAGNVLYVSGSLGLDEKTLKPVKGGAAAEARQSLKNIHAILKHAGTSFDKNTKHVYSKSATFCGISSTSFVVFGDKINGDSFTTETARTSNPVNIVFTIGRQIVIDDQRNLLYINASSQQISVNHSTLRRVLQKITAWVILRVSYKSHRVSNFHSSLLMTIIQTFQCQFFLLNKNAYWITHEMSAHIQNVLGHCSRQQNDLNIFFEELEHLFNLIFETSRQHFISFQSCHKHGQEFQQLHGIQYPAYACHHEPNSRVGAKISAWHSFKLVSICWRIEMEKVAVLPVPDWA
ncbi:hypothetical protein AGLY_004584 [Aphis glycines]|uniref:Uncharacterized protein n=1 Tax=Aphis glycines TaxID=307491 RepID=A0A6G0TUD7_APHGL|nr:hypothetical protein AGLY_004584 [Aphis glycines]